MLPTRSASGGRFMAGVEGGGQLLEVAGLGVTAVLPTFLAGGTAFAAGRFSFSALRCLLVSAVGAPSMNWKALSLVRVCVDGMIGGPVTTCLVGGAVLLFGRGQCGGAFRGRHWPLNCCYGRVKEWPTK